MFFDVPRVLAFIVKRMKRLLQWKMNLASKFSQSKFLTGFKRRNCLEAARRNMLVC